MVVEVEEEVGSDRVEDMVGWERVRGLDGALTTGGGSKK